MTEVTVLQTQFVTALFGEPKYMPVAHHFAIGKSAARVSSGRGLQGRQVWGLARAVSISNMAEMRTGSRERAFSAAVDYNEHACILLTTRSTGTTGKQAWCPADLSGLQSRIYSYARYQDVQRFSIYLFRVAKFILISHNTVPTLSYILENPIYPLITPELSPIKKKGHLQKCNSTLRSGRLSATCIWACIWQAESQSFASVTLVPLPTNFQCDQK